MEFQSTPPVKAATRAKFLRAKTYIISIHAAREGGDAQHEVFAELVAISIHAAREGGDAFYHIVRVVSHHFNPRRP